MAQLFNEKLMNNSLSKKQIIDLLPHREPMLLIDELKDIKKLFSATAVMYVKKMHFMSMVISLTIQFCQEF